MTRLPPVKIEIDPETLTSETKCGYCTRSTCCTYVTQHIDTPRSMEEYDTLLWQVSHENMQIYKDDDGWFLVANNPCTHLQTDHISGGRHIAERTGAEYCINTGDAQNAAYQYRPLEDHTLFRFGSSALEAIHSPGHTPGSVSLLLDEKFLFSGDTVMVSSIGRPDLGGKVREWAHLLYTTLFERYKDLADEIIVLPTHVASLKDMGRTGIARLSLGEARDRSDLYQLKDEHAFTQYIEHSLLENPERYQDIRRVNLGLLSPDEEKQKELEIGKNLCGMAGKKQ